MRRYFILFVLSLFCVNTFAQKTLWLDDGRCMIEVDPTSDNIDVKRLPVDSGRGNVHKATNVVSVEHGTRLDYGDCSASGSSVSWSFWSDSTLIVSGTGKMADYSGSVLTPWLDYFKNGRIKRIIVEEGVTYIGKEAFDGAHKVSGSTTSCYVNTSINEVIFPSTLQEIGDCSFWTCCSIKTITCKSTTPPTAINHGIHVFYDAAKTIPVYVPSASVASYKADSQWGVFTNIQAIQNGDDDRVVASGSCGVDGDNVKWVLNRDSTLVISGSGAMKDYTKGGEAPWYSNRSMIKVISIESRVTKVGGYAFYGCKGVNSVSMDSTITAIGAFSFWDCTGISSVTIPASVTAIINGAFGNCTGLKKIFSYNTTPPTCGTEAFVNVSTTSCILYVPAASREAYAAANEWKSFINIHGLYDKACTLSDNQSSYDNSNQAGVYSEIDYTRTFSNVKWQALYVPFSIAYDEWLAEFEMAQINNVHQYDDNGDGTVDRIELEAIRMKSGATKPNTPYLIRPYTVGEKTITAKANPVLYATAINSIDCSSMSDKFIFTGTYNTIDGSTMTANKYYALSGGVLAKAASADASLGAFRWYLSIEDRAGAKLSLNAVKVKVIGKDETTGISQIEWLRLGEQGSGMNGEWKMEKGSAVQKCIENGRLVIKIGGKTYNTAGEQVY